MHASDRPQRSPAAWLLPFADSREWLRVLEPLASLHSALRLFVLPKSSTDRSPSGVLVVPPAGGYRTLRRAIPYGCLDRADRRPELFFPCEGVFSPPTSTDEITRSFPRSLAVVVWHPGTGPIGFEAEEELRLADLIAFESGDSVRGNESWDAALPGVAIRHRIVSIDGEPPSTLPGVFGDAARDIGGRPETLSELPLRPEEEGTPSPKTSLRERMAKWIAKRAAKNSERTSHQRRSRSDRKTSGSSLSGRAASGASGPIGRLLKWSGEVLASKLREQREREMRRLMSLLGNDPDRGLKFALPLTGTSGGGRGTAMPSGSLAERHVDFRLGGGSGGPTDLWDLDHAWRQELEKTYRQLALREQRLGRYRRAAYIHAELLGDFQAAANALVEGGFHREAAVLFRDRLRNPQGAAECLETAGLLTEAIPLWERLGEFERAGTLFDRLDMNEEATRCFRQAVGKHVSLSQYREAARIANDHLRDHDETLDLLERGWRFAADGARCLEDRYRFLTEWGEHEEIVSDLQLRFEQHHGDRAAFSLVQVTGKLLAETTVPEIRGVIVDRTQHLASHRLPEATETQRKILLEAVQNLFPDDRLLARDCTRYAEGIELAAERSRIALQIGSVVQPKEWAIRQVQNFVFEVEDLIDPVVCFDRCLIAFSLTTDANTPARRILQAHLFDFDGGGSPATEPNWELTGEAARVSGLRVHPGSFGMAVWIHFNSHPVKLPSRPVQRSGGRDIHLKSRPSLPSGTIDFFDYPRDLGAGDRVFLVDVGEVELRFVNGANLETQERITWDRNLVSETLRKHSYLIPFGRYLVVQEPGEIRCIDLKRRRVLFNRPVSVFAPVTTTPPGTPPRLVIPSTNGQVELWDPENDTAPRYRIQTGLSDPLTHVLPNGFLVVADQTWMSCYRIDTEIPEKIADHGQPVLDLFQIVDGPDPETFTVCGRRGDFQVFSVRKG